MQPCFTDTSETNENNESPLSDNLQKRIQKALFSTIVKAVSKAILEDVTNEVYKAIDFDINSKTEKITQLETKISSLEKQLSSFQSDIEEQEQYSRRNCLRFHGIRETDDESTDEVVIKVIRERLGVDIQPQDLDRSHRIPLRNREHVGNNVDNPAAKPIIVKFARYNIRSRVYAAKKGTKRLELINDLLMMDASLS